MVQNERQQRFIAKRKAARQCLRCGSPLGSDDVTNCKQCKSIGKEMARQQRNKRAAKSLCTVCGTAPNEPGIARCALCSAKEAARQREYIKRLHNDVFTAYGGKCTCCGEPNYLLLTLDHVNNNGAEHRKVVGKYSHAMYKWARDNNYPSELQILCWNCNAAKQYHGEGIQCPAHNEGT